MERNDYVHPSRVSAVVAAFDRLAAQYDRWYETPLGSLCDALEKETVFSLACVEPGEWALDVSCGTGNYALELARREAKVVGVDPSARMLEIASIKARERGVEIEFQQARVQSLPFPDGTFDLVTSILVLEFTHHPARVIEEMFRVLKPGGRLVIGVLNRYSLWAIIRRVKALFFPSLWREARFLSRRDLTRLLMSQGCQGLRWRSAIYFPPINQRWLLERCQFVERPGQRFLPQLGAFVAVAATRTNPRPSTPKRLGSGMERLEAALS